MEKEIYVCEHGMVADVLITQLGSWVLRLNASSRIITQPNMRFLLNNLTEWLSFLEI